jgi:hypothetical protein
MSTNATHDTTDPSAEHDSEDDEETAEDSADADARVYSAGRAMSSGADGPVWKRNPNDLSGGREYVRASQHLDTGHPHDGADPDEVTSS